MRADQSARDVLIGGLLALDELVRGLDAADRVDDETAWAARAAHLHAVVECLCTHGARPTRRTGGRLAYGIPRWLVDPMPPPPAVPRGLGALLARDLTGGSARWTALLAELDGDAWLADLYRLQNALERTSPAHVADPAPGTALAAATGLRAVADVDPVDDPLGYDLVLRRTRTDIALVHPDAPHGILLGLTLTAERGVDVRGRKPNAPGVAGRFTDPWSPYAPRFVQGVDGGRRLALELLAGAGVGDDDLEPWHGLRFEVVGLLPPVSVDEESAALAVALHIVAEVAGMPAPGRLGVVCTGSVRRGVVEPITAAHLDRKLEAVRVDGVHRELLYPRADGWARQAVDAGAPSVRSGPLTLAGAAEALWGDQWRQWVDDQRTTALHAAGWSRWDARRRSIASAIPVTVPPKASTLAKHFRSGHPTTAVVGGPANSGKTTVAACVGDLLALENWQVLGFSSHTHELNEPGELVKVIAQAVTPHLKPGLKTLIVLDGLWPVGRNNNLGVALGKLHDRLKTSVLVTARFEVDVQREWNTGSATTVSLFVDPGAMRRFAEHVIGQQPVLSELRPLAGVLAKAAGPDLWMLTQMLNWAATRAHSSQDAADHLRAAFLRDRLSLLAEPERERARQLAAASLLATGLTDAETGLDPETLATLGARRGGTDGWVLPSSVLCRMVLSDAAGVPSPQAVEQRVLALTRPRLHDLLRAGDGARIVKLLVGSGHFSDRVLSALVKASRDEIVAWAMSADPVLIARLLQLADSDLGPQACERLVVRLCHALPAALVNASRLVECLRMINRYRHFVERGNAFADVVSGLRDGGLKLALELNASPAARLNALRQLERFHHPQLSRLVLLHLPLALQGLSTEQADDYLTVRRAEDLRQRVVAELAADDVPAPATAAVLADLPTVAAMLDRKPTRTDGIALFINALILRMMFKREDTDWEAVLEHYDVVLRNALDQSPLSEQVRAFRNLADYHRALCVRLLNRPDLARFLGRQLESSQPAEVAFLLRTVMKLHGKFTKDLLYESDETPKAELVRHFAEKITNLGESKGAGMLLNATAAIDDLYGSRGRGFANALAEELTADFAETLVRTDQRPSVIAHFLHGLWEAGADYLDRVMHLVEDVTVQWVINSNRAWAPRLALLLGADDERGERFLATLAGKIDDATLLDRMLTTLKPEALATHHQLGRALFPELPVRFAKSFDSIALDTSLLTARAEQFLRCCLEIRNTLIAAGAPAGPQVLAKVGWAGAQELRRVRHPGDLAESLRLLAKLNPAAAADVVDGLSAEPSEHNADRGFLEHQVRRALPNPSTAVELLSAVETSRDGGGVDLLRNLRAVPGSWHAFGVEIAHTQDPREQAKILLQLIALGLHRGQPGTGWMDPLAQKWLRTVPSLRSPHAIADLIRMFTAWDQATGAAVANAVNTAKLTSRLAEGAATDLRAAWRIMSAFVLAWREDRAHDVARALEPLDAETVMRACGLSDGARLVRVLHRIDPIAARRYADALAGMVDRAIARRHVVDRTGHWLDIGWAAHAVTDSLSAVPLGTTRPPVLPDGLDPGIGAWGVTWLAPVEWVEGVHANAMGMVTRSGPPKSPAAAAALLIGVATRGGLDAVEPGAWTHAGDASFGNLCALFEHGADHPLVAPVLRLVAEKVRRRLDQPTARADFDAHLLRRML
ncbi:hypothetical protein [Saccharothrix hoggarensis]|uniref:Uncharacterized protein n=1 Tax=Saccharothrix hoggarensis TaxID=913853 RepID=A0ABW3QYG6_9PSEU